MACDGLSAIELVSRVVADAEAMSRDGLALGGCARDKPGR